MSTTLIEQIKAELRREFARSGGKATSERKKQANKLSLARANQRRFELGQIKKLSSHSENSGK